MYKNYGLLSKNIQNQKNKLNNLYKTTITTPTTQHCNKPVINCAKGKRVVSSSYIPCKYQKRSLKEKLDPLPDETVVYPGHGASTTIGHEREYNPFWV